MKIDISKDEKCIVVEGLNIETIGATAYNCPVSIGGYKWFDELSDPDWFFPSCPHLHCKEKPYKLNVYTGELYDIRSKKVSSIERVGKKDLKELWKNKKFENFADKMRAKFLERFPNGVLPETPNFKSYRLVVCKSNTIKWHQYKFLRSRIFRRK